MTKAKNDEILDILSRRRCGLIQSARRFLGGSLDFAAMLVCASMFVLGIGMVVAGFVAILRSVR